MNRAFKISFEGLEFYIDEDARILFYSFIENSEKLINERKQSISDFRGNIRSEINNLIISGNQVLTLSDIEPLINSISAKYNLSTKKGHYSRKQLIRDKSSSIIGGVCAGLSNHYNISVNILRFLFIIFTIFKGFGLLVYLILWFVLPSARIYYYQPHKTDSTIFHNLIKAIVTIISVILRSIGFIIGVVFILTGVALITRYVHTGNWDHEWFKTFDLSYFDSHFSFFSEYSFYLTFCILILIAIPVLYLVISIIKQLFNIHSNNRVLKLTFALIWFICLLTVIGLMVSKNETNHNNRMISSREIQLENINSSKIYIETSNLSHSPEYKSVNGYVWVKGEKVFAGHPDINIKKTNNDKIFIKLKKELLSKHNNRHNASFDNVSYQWYQKDSLLVFDKCFYARNLKWWQFPKITVDLFIPSDKQVLKLYNPEDDLNTNN